MKKFVFLTLFVLSANVSCATPKPAEGMLEPGSRIGNMTVEEHPASTKYPDIWDYCDYPPDKKEPDTQTIDCDVPLMPKMEIILGWSAKDAALMDSNWNAMTWALSIDGYPINLDEFEQWSESGRPDLGVNQNMRGWRLDLNNPSPGKHTLRFSWTSETPIDDGFGVYDPGTHEIIVNFTVLDK